MEVVRSIGTVLKLSYKGITKGATGTTPEAKVDEDKTEKTDTTTDSKPETKDDTFNESKYT